MSETEASKVRLSELEILRFDRVLPGTKLAFNEGFNVLLGKNGTGKTSFLKLLEVLLSFRFEDLKEQDFHFRYVFSVHEADFTVEVQNERQRIEMPPALSKGEPQYRNRWHFQFSWKDKDNGHQYILTGDQRRTVLQEGTQEETEVGEVWGLFEGNLLIRWVSVLLGNTKANRCCDFIFVLFAQRCPRFDEALDYFHDLTTDSRLGYSVKFKDDSIKQVDIHGDVSSQLGLAFVSKVSHPPNVAHQYSYTRQELACFERWCGLAGFEDIAWVFKQTRREDGDLLDVVFFASNRLEFILQPGRSIDHNSLSFGQKRLFAFLYYLSVFRDIVIADEMVNGLHHAWIKACVEDIGNRQAFLTSQNPLLLDFLPPVGSVDEARRRFIRCSTNAEGLWQWRNLTDEEAEGFFAASEAGIQHTGEILRTQGLW